MAKVIRIAALSSILAGVLLAFVGCQEPVPPIIACIDADPTIGYAPLTITFDAACTFVPPERAGAHDYRWEFGDGAEASGRSAIHTFALPGTYEVFLYILDNDMGEFEVLASAERVVTVLPVP